MIRAIRLAVTCIRVEEIVTDLRYVNAGAKLGPDTDRAFRIEISGELQESIEKYADQLRLDDIKLGAARLGGTYLRRFDPVKDDWSRALVSLFMPEIPLTPETLKNSPTDECVQFVFVPIYLDEALSSIPWREVSSELLRELRLLCSLLRVAWIDLGTQARLWRVIHEGGLTMYPSSALANYLSRVCQEASEWSSTIFPGASDTLTVDDAIEFLTRLDLGRTERYWGPAMRIGKDYFCVDIVAVTLRIEALLSRATAGGGSVSGYRGKHWEEWVQGAIDETPWRPTGHVRGLISKKLKANGKVFTDVDAVGCQSDQLMIVSCKSWQLGTALDLGEFSARRNKSKDVVKAALKLRNDLYMLRTHGADNGFSVDAFADIRGVLCITAPFLLLEEDAEFLEREAPEVSIMTLSELKFSLAGEELEMADPQAWQEYARASYLIGDRKR